MATIRKRSWTTPSGAARTAWIVSYSAGKKRHIKTFRAKKDAEAWRASTMVEIARHSRANLGQRHCREGGRALVGTMAN
jgi:hypothetical protein